jgi:PhoPQ-activated pathogenicity-related protein
VSIQNELLKYVSAGDTTRRWDLLRVRRVHGGALHDVRLTSQTWQGIVWTHRLHLYLPDCIAVTDWALLTIGSDSPDDEELTHIDFDLAQRVGLVCAHLYDVPNQPLFDGLREDELLAHTLTQYLHTDDVTWPLLFPMVKAAAAAMDAVASACAEDGRACPARFVLHGASKRAWTSWLTAAADPRVGAIVPEVYDNLNLFAQMPHQVKVWETYSEMIDDYTEQRLQDKMRTPRGHQLALTVDPYTYRKQLALPKLLIHGLNDRYWATDALNLYWDDLLGDKYVLYAPNDGHHIVDRARVLPTQAAFLRAVLTGVSLPDLSAAFDETESGFKIELRAGTPALESRVWTAHSANQDFRSALWESRMLSPDGDRQVFTGRITHPNSGFTAVVGECLFPSEAGSYLLSTQVRVLSAAGAE